MKIFMEVKEKLVLDISGYSLLKIFKLFKEDYCFIDLYYLKVDLDINLLVLHEEMKEVK